MLISLGPYQQIRRICDIVWIIGIGPNYAT